MIQPKPTLLLTSLVRWLLGVENERWLDDVSMAECNLCHARALRLGLVEGEMDADGRAFLTDLGEEVTGKLVRYADGLVH